MPYSRRDFSMSSALVMKRLNNASHRWSLKKMNIPASTLRELAGSFFKTHRWGVVMGSTLVLLVPCNISLWITEAWHRTQCHNELQRTHTKMTTLGVPRGSRVLKGGSRKKRRSILIHYNEIEVWRLGLKFYICFFHIRSLNFPFLYPPSLFLLWFSTSAFS